MPVVVLVPVVEAAGLVVAALDPEAAALVVAALDPEAPALVVAALDPEAPALVVAGLVVAGLVVAGLVVAALDPETAPWARAMKKIIAMRTRIQTLEFMFVFSRFEQR